MEPVKQEKWKSFLLAFVLTLALLAVIMVLTVMAVQPAMPQANRGAPEPDVISFRPPAEDTLTMAVIGTGKEGATDFLLIRFNPQYGQIPLTLLPPATSVHLNDKDMTLGQAYEAGGGIAVKQALSQTFGIAVDRYAKLPRDAFIRLADKTGSVVFTLPYDISYSKNGYAINIGAGERRLDGRDIADIFAYPALNKDPIEKSKLLGELTAAIVNQNLDAAGDAVSSGLFKLAVNLLDTDVTSADYELRRSSADFISKLDAQVAGCIPVDGSTSDENTGFVLHEGFVDLIRQYFQTV